MIEELEGIDLRDRRAEDVIEEWRYRVKIENVKAPRCDLLLSDTKSVLKVLCIAYRYDVEIGSECVIYEDQLTDC